MDDFTQKITSILNDPDSLDTIKSIADSLMLDKGEKHQTSNHSDSGFDLSQMLGSISTDQMGGIMRVMSALNSNRGDDRTALLLALKPHLSKQRQPRVDKAVKLLKIASIMPLVSESGLFEL